MDYEIFNGYEIRNTKEGFIYADNKQPVWGSNRVCGKCSIPNTVDGDEEYDGCIGKLQGDVMNACCGHGNSDCAYIQYLGDPDDVLRGEDAIKEQTRLIAERDKL